MKIGCRHALVLAGSLSQNGDERVTCEKALKDLEAESDYVVKICEVVLDTTQADAVRQMGSVVLKRYVQRHWLAATDKFEPPEISEPVKARMREILPLGLKEPTPVIRKSIASAIAAVAHFDWPECWPQLFPILSEAVKSDDVNLVAGAMSVLVEFSQDLSDQQVTQLGPALLQELLRIFVADQIYSNTIRTQAIEICSTIVNTVCFMSEVDKKMTQKLLKPILPQMADVLVQSLTAPSSEIILKTEVLKLVAILLEKFPKMLSTFVPRISEAIFTLFKESLSEYTTITSRGCENDENYVEYDGKQFSLNQLITGLFEVIQTLVENEGDRLLSPANKEELVYLSLHYMQMSTENVSDWRERIEQYCEEEDAEAVAGTVRNSALDLILALTEQSGKSDDTMIPICKAVARVVEEGNNRKASGDPDWWKLHESCFLAMGGIADDLAEFPAPERLPFTSEQFVASVIMPGLIESGVDYLQGQALWFTARVAKKLQPIMIQQLLEVCSNALEQKQSSVLRVLSLKAVTGFADHLKERSEADAKILDPFARKIILSIINLATVHGENIMFMALTGLASVIKICPEVAAHCEARVVPLATACLLKYSGDPLIPTAVCDIVKLMGSSQLGREALEKRLLPSISSIIGGDAKRLPIRLQSVAIDVLESLIRGGITPLSPAVMNVFPVLVKCIMSTDDSTTLSSGRECIRAYISVAAEQVAMWKDAEGNDGVTCIFKVIEYLLSPSAPEMAAGTMGPLISVLVKRLETNLTPHLVGISAAVLAKYRTCDAAMVKQSLIMVFAHLMHHYLPNVLEFLKSQPGDQGHPTALQYIMTEWCERQPQLIGAYDRQVSTLAICKLFEYIVSSNDPTLMQMTVKDESMTATNSLMLSPGVKTRSRAPKSAAVPMDIPLLVKLFKLLIVELSDIIENQAALGDVDETLDDDDSEEEEDTEDDVSADNADGNPAGREALQTIISELAGDVPSDDEDESDPDAMEDPLNKVDLKTHLVDFLRQFTQTSQFQSCSPFVTVAEKNLLQIAQVIE